MDGIILMNKPKNYTSHDIVAITKKTLNEKVGHTGTLDPNATGVLPLLIGKATKISKYLINHDKIYKATLKLGIKTDTGDVTGNILEEKNVNIECLEKENVEEVLKQFVGKIQQIPPMYSAIKLNGKKLYEYARKGATIQIEPRNIEIYDITLQNINKENKQISFIVNCSKGTYIRTLCEDVAEKLNTVGTMQELERIQVGQFNINKCISVEQLQKESKEVIEKSLIKIEDIFEKNGNINLKQNELQMFLNGVKLAKNEQDGVYKIYSNNQFIGLATINNGRLKRDVVI